jgi:hypothetical protein
MKSVQEIFPSCFPKAARNAFKYLPGNTAIFMAASVTICVVSTFRQQRAVRARRNS